jgi:alkanesulfonate monooxygenase SsuD/methylene tetrahydromethanopterin reductase-like flavin-dependent oxidoreductase (luciferase family)
LAEQERRTREYHRRIRSCEPAGAAVNDRVATLNFLYCHANAGVASERGLLFLGNFAMLNAHLLFTREAYPTRAYQSLANLAPSPTHKGGPGDRPGVPEGICIGDPAQIVEQIKRWESIGVDEINFLLNSVEVLSQEEVLASLRLFASDVMPAFGGASF